MSTRLHYQICDQKGLAYSVSGNLCACTADSALIEIDAGCAHAKLPDLVGEGLSIMVRFRDEPVSEAELDKAKRRFRADLEACWASTACAVGLVAPSLRAPASASAGAARAASWTACAPRTPAARRVIRAERLCVVVVGALDRAVARKVSTIVREFR